MTACCANYSIGATVFLLNLAGAFIFRVSPLRLVEQALIPAAVFWRMQVFRNLSLPKNPNYPLLKILKRY